MSPFGQSESLQLLQRYNPPEIKDDPTEEEVSEHIEVLEEHIRAYSEELPRSLDWKGRYGYMATVLKNRLGSIRDVCQKDGLISQLTSVYTLQKNLKLHPIYNKMLHYCYQVLSLLSYSSCSTFGCQILKSSMMR